MLKNILLAEDDRVTSLLLKRQLEGVGHKVTVVSNGREALKVIASQQVDLLITDVVMPEMDGVDLYMALQGDPNTCKLPIIIMTDKQMFKDSFSALGVEHFMPKNVDVHLLLDKIRNVENTVKVNTPLGKVLIGGCDRNVVERMQGLLQEEGCLVTCVDNSMDMASRVFLMNPNVIFLDIMMKESTTPKELIRAFRSLNIFQKTPIIVYAALSSSQMAPDSMVMAVIDEDIQACLSAGATKYIGRFSPLTFIDTVRSLGILQFDKRLAVSA
jgi:CheY-like chemotaxis protein